MLKEQHQRRKIQLFNGDEALDTKATERKHSVYFTLRVIKREFQHYPSMTHAVIRDLRGKTWELHRYDSIWRRLKILFFAA